MKYSKPMYKQVQIVTQTLPTEAFDANRVHILNILFSVSYPIEHV